ncbi:MAG: nucleoside 2-deoxyribosyltransferase domain-containing protein [Candidatus Dormibacteria bacterium]
MARQMRIVYRDEPLPRNFAKSIFLAGPSPRSPGDPDWRVNAVRELADLGFDGVVYIPFPRPGKEDTMDPWRWEHDAMMRSDVIAFWVPRSQKLPGYTTNIEWGEFYRSGRCVLGCPPKTPGMDRMRHMAKFEEIPFATTLRDTMLQCIGGIGQGAPRSGGECSIPIKIWRTHSFQEWYMAQCALGGKLLRAEVQWTSAARAPHIPPAAFKIEAAFSTGTAGQERLVEVLLTERHAAPHVIVVPNKTAPLKSTVIIMQQDNPDAQPYIPPRPPHGLPDPHPLSKSPRVSFLERVLDTPCTVTTSQELRKLRKELVETEATYHRTRTTLGSLLKKNDPLSRSLALDVVAALGHARPELKRTLRAYAIDHLTSPRTLIS